MPRPPKRSGRKVADQLRPKLPELAGFLDEAETDVLAYMTYPPQHRTKLHSTNPIERLNAPHHARGHDPAHSGSIPARSALAFFILF